MEWMGANKLRLNTDKVLFLCSSSILVNSSTPILDGVALTPSSTCVHSLSILLDPRLLLVDEQMVATT